MRGEEERRQMRGERRKETDERRKMRGDEERRQKRGERREETEERRGREDLGEWQTAKG
jgi:hypothetical protein